MVELSWSMWTDHLFLDKDLFPLLNNRKKVWPCKTTIVAHSIVLVIAYSLFVW